MQVASRSLAAAVFVAAFSPLVAQGALITSPAGLVAPVTTPAPAYTGPQSPGYTIGPFLVPVPFGNGISYTSSSSGTYYGASEYILLDNGQWLNLNWVGTAENTKVTFDLGGLFGAVGGFMNYATPGAGTPVIRVLDAGGNELESHDLSVAAPISTPGGVDQGAFRGIQRASADIRFFEIDGAFLLVNSLTTADPGTSVVPVPASLPLLASGLVALFAWQRRRAA
ncbi:MAG: hypothetical protein ACK515_26485 [bacterium]|nr:hypothetical protein [Betaproteobacteria bacterium]